LGIFAGLILGVIWFVFWLVSSLVWLIPPSVEQQLGALIVPVYEQLAQPSPAQDTLNQLLDKLETNLPQQRQQREYKVLYIPDSTVNALALPGDRIVIYSGLVNRVKSENELMMVLGHELGHFAHRDHLRSLGQELFLPIAIASLLGDNSWVYSSAATIISAASQAQYSQFQEIQADKFGLTLLYKTYGHVAGATDFFERLSQQQDLDLAFLSSHPAPGKRVVQLKQLIQQRGYSVGERSPLKIGARNDE
jgi:predicted Zn-dependent protease